MSVLERESHLTIQVGADADRVFDAALKGMEDAGLRITAKDATKRTAEAETKTLKAILRNSYGETVSMAVEGDAHVSEVRLRSVAKSKLGFCSHKHLRKIVEALAQSFGRAALTRRGHDPNDRNSQTVLGARTKEGVRSVMVHGEINRPVKSSYALSATLALVAFGLAWYLIGGGLEKHAAQNLEEIRIKVAADAVERYEIAKRNGTPIDACVQAGIVTAAYLQAKDEANYRMWKVTEDAECAYAGLRK